MSNSVLAAVRDANPISNKLVFLKANARASPAESHSTRSSAKIAPRSRHSKLKFLLGRSRGTWDKSKNRWLRCASSYGYYPNVLYLWKL